MNSEACPFGENLQRYWDRLSAIERRMALDPEALYSLTPQTIAMEIAAQVPGKNVVDAFCGAGGLAIALARQGKHVIAIDIVPERLEMAKHNADLFGVAEMIDFRLGDCLAILLTLAVDSVVLDPPWGGPEYSQAQEFLLSHFSPDGNILLDTAFSVTSNIVMRLPKNFLFAELERIGRTYRVEQNTLEGRILHYSAFFE